MIILVPVGSVNILIGVAMLKKLLLLLSVCNGLNAGLEIKRPNFYSKHDIDLFYGTVEESFNHKKGFIVVDSKKVNYVKRAFTDPVVRGASEEDLICYMVQGNGYFEVIRFNDGTYRVIAMQRLLGGKKKKGGWLGGILITVASLFDRKERKKIQTAYVKEREATVRYVGEYAGAYAGGVFNVAACEVEDFVNRYSKVHLVKVINRFNEGVELSNESKREIKKAINIEFSKYSGFDPKYTAREPSDGFVSKTVRIEPRRSARLEAKRLEVEELLGDLPVVIDSDDHSYRYNESDTIALGDLSEVINPMTLTKTTSQFAEFNMTPCCPDGTPIIIDKNIRSYDSMEPSFDIDPMSLTTTPTERLILEKERPRKRRSHSSSYLARDTISISGNSVIPESDSVSMDRINMHYNIAESTDKSNDETPEWLTRLRNSANTDIHGASVSHGPIEVGARIDYEGIRSGNLLYKCIEFYGMYTGKF